MANILAKILTDFVSYIVLLQLSRYIHPPYKSKIDKISKECFSKQFVCSCARLQYIIVCD